MQCVFHPVLRWHYSIDSDPRQSAHGIFMWRAQTSWHPVSNGGPLLSILVRERGRGREREGGGIEGEGEMGEGGGDRDREGGERRF